MLRAWIVFGLLSVSGCQLISDFDRSKISEDASADVPIDVPGDSDMDVTEDTLPPPEDADETDAL